MEWDKLVFFAINGVDFPDLIEHFFVLSRNKYFWTPLYIFLISYIVIRFKKQSWLYLIAIAFCIVLCDGISSKLIKPEVERLRPCKAYPELVETRVHCGSGYSFPSSHATNHFGLSVLLIFLLSPLAKKYIIGFILWASLVSFSQVYVGVHYPIDVLTGAFLGSLIGFGIAQMILALRKRIYS